MRECLFHIIRAVDHSEQIIMEEGSVMIVELTDRQRKRVGLFDSSSEAKEWARRKGMREFYINAQSIEDKLDEFSVMVWDEKLLS